ncbi:UDP-N-acetylglucosamine 2-epimerase (non-hydrolysing) [Marininema mesophilum]|uniref:UDP-N-acetylglucosamine 2-epimerase (Non-hydrolysing) n=1 Tax=Marininema mesophilum TaxID=1048340 RepID=A0A1H2VN27_9BACL|nr:UDP-N-acetylglucosamine 2-epimerase (non-hydrolyzing) [Marininema mesophilum]SDW69269.1 UDP-N-acetylglucosamine 2-epimerase (non-hydrolysing) [Marininema mesophilum]
MKVVTFLGTRPEIIRLSRIIPKLDQLATHHVLVHTGQNYVPTLSDVFFKQLQVRSPDIHFASGGQTFGAQVGMMFQEADKILMREKPDCLLVLGDTNSALCAIPAARMGIPVYHMEAGNRCFDTRVPEEINRRLIDSVSTFNLPYTSQSRDHLLREGYHPQRVWVTGNPIFEVIQHHEKEIEKNPILRTLGLTSGSYILVTAHRAENVDQKDRLTDLMDALQQIAQNEDIPVIVSVHPRTQDKIDRFGIHPSHPGVKLLPPFGFFDFIQLQKHARCVITDSGTVQEESCILGVPAIIIRDSTERPETVTCGGAVVSGLSPERIHSSVTMMTQGHRKWSPPEEYMQDYVSDVVVNMILGGCSHV